jgi:hypothetical protein
LAVGVMTSAAELKEEELEWLVVVARLSACSRNGKWTTAGLSLLLGPDS